MKKMMNLLILLSALMFGCKKDDQPAVDPNAITNDEIRFTITITAPGVQANDSYTFVCNCHNPNYYDPKGNLKFKKISDNVYSIDLKASEVADSPDDLVYNIYRNESMIELGDNCQPVQLRRLYITPNKGKEITFTVPAFQATGSCPP